MANDTRLKVGDRVRVYGHGLTRDYDSGSLGTVIDQDNGHYSVKVKSDEGTLDWYHPKQLRKIKPKKNKEKSFKIGDLVWVSKDHAQWVIDHMYMYFLDKDDNKALDSNYWNEMQMFLSALLAEKDIPAKVIGFGSDTSTIRVAYEYEYGVNGKVIIEMNSIEEYIERSYIKTRN